MLEIASTIIGLLGLAVLATCSPQNGIILPVIAFLVSPFGLPMAAWLVSKARGAGSAVCDSGCGVGLNRKRKSAGGSAQHFRLYFRANFAYNISMKGR